MSLHHPLAVYPAASRLPSPYRDEIAVVQGLVQQLHDLNWPAVIEEARPWVREVRSNPAPFWAMESLLREYPISSQEGLALMRLAEALLRVPDTETAIALTADQLGRAQFDGASEGPHRVLANLSTQAIALSRKFLPDGEGGGLLGRLGAHTVVAATVRAIQLMGRQFVLGRNIHEAMSEAEAARRSAPQQYYSYDMLGEGARTEEDAERYQTSYLKGIEALASRSSDSADPMHCDGISIKLSALFSRYEESQRSRVFAVLVPRVWALIGRAAQANINLTVDAEEVDRLEISLDLIDAWAGDIAKHFPQWKGFGLALQSYQTRAPELVEAVAAIARKHGIQMMVRLVKGAYWDGEVKRAQELGLPQYPVFTHKHHTDIAYLACAQTLLAHNDVIYPQFATHNAGTIAALLQMARKVNGRFEMQRLHGMAESVYREVMKTAQVPLRVYAPVGEHRDLLAYLVRRLLENGANSSFVHQLSDEDVQVEELLLSPLRVSPAPALPDPLSLYDSEGLNRRNSQGVDLVVPEVRKPYMDALAACTVPDVALTPVDQIDAVMRTLQTGATAWAQRSPVERALPLRRAADALEARMPEFCALLVKEAHKSLSDTIAEVREAVDFLRYYAGQTEQGLVRSEGGAVFVCISPWNFPLAIFAGQVAAALVSGHAVAAKPAEQTPFIAERMVALLHDADVPADALALVVGAGDVGAALVSHPWTGGVAFTGSTAVAQHIQKALARKGQGSVPLIAETGGINAMIVDSSALPEQVVDAVVLSAFRSAGQRCSALRLLCVHDDVADGMIEMIRGALKELRVGNPANWATDVGPLIDEEAFQNIFAAVQDLRTRARWVGEAHNTGEVPRLLAPVAFEVPSVSVARAEIFGPVLQIVRWKGDIDEVVRSVNALGFGLTMGIQTRIDSRAERMAKLACIGNVYINRNMIGAVVGVQPFGGEGMSGTGPKAGGPLYLRRLAEARPMHTAVAVTAPEAVGQVQAPLQDAFKRLASAWPTWRATPANDRLALVERVLKGLNVKSAPALAAVRELSPSRVMPGPTGESNEWRTQGRGVWVVVPGLHETHRWDGLWAALAAGNAVLVCTDGQDDLHLAAQTLRENLLREGLPAGTVQVTAAALQDVWASAAALNGADHLVGVVGDMADPARASALQQGLAALPGCLRLWVAGPSAQGELAVYRLFAEQTVTINTAAAGGNAALLASMGAH